MQIDILCLTETWLTNGVFNNELLPEDYSIYRRDRESQRGGDVLIAIRNVFKSKLLFTHPSLELITVEIFVSPKVIHLCCVYLPPNRLDTYDQQLFAYFKSISDNENVDPSC